MEERQLTSTSRMTGMLCYTLIMSILLRSETHIQGGARFTDISAWVFTNLDARGVDSQSNDVLALGRYIKLIEEWEPLWDSSVITEESNTCSCHNGHM